ITGTVIEKDVERGTVIASATSNVCGGTTLLKMAELNLVQVRTLVDETDVGKIQPGQQASVTVDAFPNRTFDGTVLKIEPQAQTEQNVTVFPVLVRIDNKEGLLRPGMNTEVEVHVGRREHVAAVPNAALRTQRDVASAAQVLGLSSEDVQRQLAATSGTAGRDTAGRGSAGGSASSGATPRGTDGGATRPDSATARRSDAARSRQGAGGDGGGQGTAAQSGAAQAAPRQFGGRNRATRGTDAGGGRYIVFAKRNGAPTPVWIRTGLTDLDYSEVLHGLEPGDSVYVLPSASLVQSQEDMRQRMNQMTGGGAVPGMQQQGGARAGGAATQAR
ncbi:MAG TPA: efflux RND transporter periplasmic adaptor subunit, partial [Gemmatimonadales bacterium]|nr:efflux RND transporter periplasmic adaptor subunit [Gemmatimonadales bacterium]